VIWVGTFLISAHVVNAIPLYPPGFGYAMLVSPLFTNFVLTRVYSQSWKVIDIRYPGFPH